MAHVANHSSVPRQSVIPTFIDNMPPSPTRKQNNRQSSASGNSRTNKGKRQNLKVTPVSTPTTFLPSVVAEHYAEDDRLSHYPSSYSTQSQHAIASDSDDDASSDESSPERTSVSSAATSGSTGQPIYVQVLLQVGGHQQIPINIPAEMILPSLVSALGGNRVESVGNGRSSGPSTPVALPAGVTRTSSTGDLRQNVTPSDNHKKHPLSGAASSPVTTSIPKIPRLLVPPTPSVLPNPPPALRYFGAAPRQAAPPSTLVHKLPTSSSVPSPSYTSTKRELSSESDGEDNKNQQMTYSNRAAASRCRQKKKQQIEEMENKTKSLQEANKSLEAEMEALKSEIEQYEAALAEHAECLAIHNVYYVAPS